MWYLFCLQLFANSFNKSTLLKNYNIYLQRRNFGKRCADRTAEIDKHRNV